MDKSTARRRAVIIAVLLGVVLATMTFSLRGSFWTSQDYGMLSLSHALHLEQRLRHWESNPAPGLAGHPGIPFYFASWLAVALVVPPFSAAGFDRFSEIIANAEAIYVANQAIAIVLVALGCYAFVRVATRVAPLGVSLAALGMWLGSTYQAILTSTSLSIETFALPLNVLFLWILLRLAASPRISAADSVIAGVVAALGYLLKLPYLYVAFGLFAAFIASTIVHRDFRQPRENYGNLGPFLSHHFFWDRPDLHPAVARLPERCVASQSQLGKARSHFVHRLPVPSPVAFRGFSACVAARAPVQFR